MNDLRNVLKKLEAGKSNLGKTLRELEMSGDINSDGEITVADTINLVNGYRTESYLIDQSKNIRHLNVGLIKKGGKNGMTLVITEYGKLYLSK